MSAPQVSLFGRDKLLREISESIHRGQTRFALEGRSGAGKSALLDEICRRYRSFGFEGVASINAAQWAREDIVIARIYLQLRDLVRDPRTFAERLKEKFAKDVPSTLVSVGSAVAADMVSLATDKAGHTIDAVKGLLGRAPAAGVASQLEGLEKSNRRFFLDQFLATLAECDHHVVIAIDNFERADTSLFELVRNLVLNKPDAVAIVLAHNTEIGVNESWDNVLAHIRARAGAKISVGPLERTAMSQWFESALGRPPTTPQLDLLEAQTQGRPSAIARVLQAFRDGIPPQKGPDFSGYYEQARRKLTPDARTVGDLLSVINRDAIVHQDMLAKAAQGLGVGNLGPSLDELESHRLIVREGAQIALAHSDVHQFWSQSIDGVRREQLGQVWFSVVSEFSVEQLVRAEVLPLLPAISVPLMKQRPDDLADIGARLVELGQTTSGLHLVDRLWKTEASKGHASMEIYSAALLSARTCLDLGRYAEVAEPLRMAELAAGDDKEANTQILLVRMKLALRTNAYRALAAIAGQLQNATDSAAQIEAELLRNVASRDQMDEPGMRESVTRLRALRDIASPEQNNSIDRAIARSLAKLGQNDEALTAANGALASAQSSHSIRATGNSHLAMGEVQRYRGEPAAVEYYRAAASIARSTGNRDSLLWSLLGEAAFFIERGQYQNAERSMAETKAMLDDPGYKHPLERAHHSLLDFLMNRDRSKVANIIAAYRDLDIQWPERFIDDVVAGGNPSRVTPL